jgi:hypothetical protein
MMTCFLAQADDFTVFTTDESGDGSLRQAILDANAHPGADRIVFAIPGAGVHRIELSTELPPLTEAVLIDGYTQPGSQPNTRTESFDGVLCIQLDTSVNIWHGLFITGGGCTVRGMVLDHFQLGIALASSSNLVTGNFVGLDPSGYEVPNPIISDGVDVAPRTCCNTVGGVNPEDRNVIAGTGFHGLQIGDSFQPPATNVVIQGNFIGTDRTGLRHVPTLAVGGGISVRSGEDCLIGGTAKGAGNVIVDEPNSIHVNAGLPRIQIIGNYIGVGADGRTPLGTAETRDGINVESEALIEGNRIAYHEVGIRVSTDFVTIRRNELYSNRVDAIDLGPAARTNDVGDFDLGFNGLQNYPLVAYHRDGTDIVITGTMPSRPNTSYDIDVFANPAPGPSGFGQAELYLGSTTVRTTNSGEASFEFRVPSPGEHYPWVSGTATDPLGNTSMLSPAKDARSITTPWVNVPPQNVTIRPGNNASFAVEASGATPLRYQWRWNGAALPNANAPSLLLTNVQLTHRGLYSVEISNVLGRVESDPAVLTVLSAPLFLQPPLSQTVVSGEVVTLSVVLSDFTTPPFGFRWRSNSTFVANSGPVSNFVSFLTFRAGPNTANYSVAVTNQLSPLGTLGPVATLTVTADRDQDGLPDTYETSLHLNPDDASDAAGDLDGDGASNLQEYLSGTDAEDPLSFLKLEPPLRDGGQSWLTFAAKSNKTYRLEYRDRLESEAWATLTNTPARRTNHVETLRDVAAQPSRFYRVSTPQLAPP